MALRFAFVLLFSVCAFEFGTAIPAFPLDDAFHHDVPVQFPGQSAPQCPDNEEFHSCGTACPATCANPHPSAVCTKNCVIGCFCKEGHLRNSRGLCVESANCAAAPVNAMPVQAQAQQVCTGDNEEYRQCKGCDGTCKNPNPICPRICVPGCACKEGHLRSDAGRCIATRECTAQPQSFVALQADPQCGDNEEYRKCKGCDGTCKNPNPLCPRICKKGCACKEGYLRSDAGRCIATRECTTQPQSFVMLQADPQCGENEEYRKCKGCDGTCQNPNPLCPRICKPGCACKEGHLRSDQGKCVETRECAAQRVQPASFQMLPQCGQNEIFLSCGTACPATCADPHPSEVCTRNCVIGCFCQEGFLKNARGVCVAAANCNA